MVNLDKLNNSIEELEGEIENIKTISSIASRLDENKSEILKITKDLQAISKESLNSLEVNGELRSNIKEDNRIIYKLIEDNRDELLSRLTYVDKNLDDLREELDRTLDKNVDKLSLNLNRSLDKKLDQLNIKLDGSLDKNLGSLKLNLDKSLDKNSDKLNQNLNRSLNKNLDDLKLKLDYSLDRKSKELLKKINEMETSIVKASQKDLVEKINPIEEKLNKALDQIKENQEDLIGLIAKERKLISIGFILNIALIIMMIFQIKG